MAFRKKVWQGYGEVNVQAGTAYADSVQLIQMLFDGLIDSLSAAEGQIERNEIEAKGESIVMHTHCDGAPGFLILRRAVKLRQILVICMTTALVV